MKTILFILVVFIVLMHKTIAQSDSTTLNLPKTPITNLKTHSPKTASYLSIIPGAGQVYNKKYWKIPIIYAGLGTASYFIYYYHSKSKYYTEEYVYRINNNASFYFPELEPIRTENVLGYRNTARSRMEISIAALAIIYALNIIDATVDAHLYYFDISDDLSLSLKPDFQMVQVFNNFSLAPSIGLKIKLK
ncbi:MAG TPA: DUF5683 domain-containing protein [Bacteroidales bacterium]|nr:DUF5683 domain-containing protein [Bacteroidales bacterium]